VNTAQPVRIVDARDFAVNTAVWDADFDTSNTINLLTRMGAQALRFPGGSPSDDYHWATNTTDNNTWQWATSFDSFAQVATTVGTQAFITVNYGSGTPVEAAAWVQESNVTRHYGFKYWEVGNECYGSWDTDANTVAHDPYTYAQRFQQYYTQMKAVDPTIKIGAVAVTREDNYANNTNHPVVNPRTGQTQNGWTPVMLATLHSLGVTQDFLIYHRYAQAPGAESDQGLLLSHITWSADAADLRQQLNDHLGAATWCRAGLHRKQFGLFKPRQTDHKHREWSVPGRQYLRHDEHRFQLSCMVGFAQRSGHHQQQFPVTLRVASIWRLWRHRQRRPCRPG
jgi:hypothetical protein